MKRLSVLVLIIVTSCRPSSDHKNTFSNSSKFEQKKEISDTGYILAITEIDNCAKVYVEDSLIFDSGTIHSSPEVDFHIDLTPYVLTGKEVVKLELYNGIEPYNPQSDPKWEIRYDLIIDGIIVDFVHEFGDDGRIGKAFETTYIISELKEQADL